MVGRPSTGRIYSGASGETRSLVSETSVYPLEIGTTAFTFGDLSGDGLADFVLGGGGNSDGGARVYRSIPNGGTVTYAGGPAPGTPAGCTGAVGLQCDLEPPLPACTLEAEGCFSPGSQAMLFGLSGPNVFASTLLFIGVQPINAVLPGGCSLLTNPVHSISVLLNEIVSLNT